MQRVLDIINAKEGFTQKTLDGCLSHSIFGWEMRALQELQNFGMCQWRRIIFIMLGKLSLQVNIQISCFIITHANLKQQHESDSWMMKLIVGRAVLVCVMMLYTFFTELCNVLIFLHLFKQVKNAKTGERENSRTATTCSAWAGDWCKQTPWKTLEEKTFELRDSNKIYAVEQFWETEQTDQILHTREYTGKQLRQAFLEVKQIRRKIFFWTVLCAIMFFYAPIKLVMSFFVCEGGWQLESGCLDLSEV